MARWRPRIVVPVIGTVAAVAIAVAVLTGGSSSRHPDGLTPLTTTTTPQQGALWSGNANEGTNPADVPTRYVSSAVGGNPTASIEGSSVVAVAHFSNVTTDVYLRKDTPANAAPRWLVTAAVSDFVAIGEARNDYGLASAHVTVLRAGRLIIHVGEPNAPTNAPVDVRAGDVIDVHQQVAGANPSIRAVLITSDDVPALAELLIPPGAHDVAPPMQRPLAVFPTDADERRSATPVDTARSWAEATVGDLRYTIGAFVATGAGRGEVSVQLDGSTSTLELAKGAQVGSRWSVVEVRSDRLRLVHIGSTSATKGSVELTADVDGFARLTPGGETNVRAGRRSVGQFDTFFGTVTVRLTGTDGTVAVVAALLP